MFKRIRWRVLSAFLSVNLIALSFLGLHLTRYFEHQSLEQFEQTIRTRARSLALHVRGAVLAHDTARLRAEFRETGLPGSSVVTVVDETGSALVEGAGDQETGDVALLRKDGIAAALQGREVVASTRLDAGYVTYAAVPIGTDRGILGAVFMLLYLPELTSQLSHTRTFVSWTVVATLVWSALVTLLLAHRIAKPIQEIQEATTRIAAGDLQQRVRVHTGDELEDLAGALNYMAAELERLDALRREFVADASHELRTPVANLTVAVDALRGAITTDDAGTTLLSAIEREVQRLRRLVEDLLDLSAIEAGRVELHLSRFDLARLTEDVLESFRHRAARRGMAFKQTAPADGVFARADPDRVTQILSNLIDNALKFGPQGGHVEVSVDIHRSAAVVTVDDSGPGIPAADLPHIFDRFFKVDRSRSEHRSAGLGLAIARRLATAQGGAITAENRREGGARFTLMLPT